ACAQSGVFDAADNQPRNGEVGVGAERGGGEAPDELGADHRGQDSKKAAVARSAEAFALSLKPSPTAAALRYVYIFRATVNASRYEYRRDSASRSSEASESITRSAASARVDAG